MTSNRFDITIDPKAELTFIVTMAYESHTLANLLLQLLHEDTEMIKFATSSSTSEPMLLQLSITFTQESHITKCEQVGKVLMNILNQIIHRMDKGRSSLIHSLAEYDNQISKEKSYTSN